MAMKVVGTTGGAIASTDGQLALVIPAGAVSGDVTVTVAPAEAPASGAVGEVYEIGPTGTQFAKPVVLTLKYGTASLGSTSPSLLRVATYAGGAWQLLPGAVVDTNAKTVSGLTTHLSPYAIVAESSGKTCATVKAAYGCEAAPSGGGTGTSSGGAGGASCQAPTCASASNVCAGYPGATMDSCMDAATGYVATCCFPSDAPVCFAAVGGGAKCTDPAGGGGSNCPPPPTCATSAGACGGYPGSALQSCTDTATGFNGACCFDGQSPVCISIDAARGCAAPAGGGGANCPPAPKCADANPCAPYPGATTQSCTDGTDGFNATCCFPLGTLPTAPTSSGSGGTATGDGGTAPPADGGAGGGNDGGAIDPGGGQCVQGATCSSASPGCKNASPTSCLMCLCQNGKLECSPCPVQPDGGVQPPPPDGGAVSQCIPGGTCNQGEKCGTGGGGATGGTCIECVCDVSGQFACNPCGGGQPDGGVQPPPPDGGAVSQCVPGGTCNQGEKCGTGGGGGAAGGTCMECVCDVSGRFVCNPCGGGQPDGGVQPPPPDGGATSQCAPGGMCKPGEKCGFGSAGTCMECTCSASGMFVCGPCPSAPDGGVAPPPDGGATQTCQVAPMPPPQPGASCGVSENCPDGKNYKVQCDGATGKCMCLVNGTASAMMPIVPCMPYDPMAELKACGFPAGTP